VYVHSSRQIRSLTTLGFTTTIQTDPWLRVWTSPGVIRPLCVRSLQLHLLLFIPCTNLKFQSFTGTARATCHSGMWHFTERSKNCWNWSCNISTFSSCPRWYCPSGSGTEINCSSRCVQFSLSWAQQREICSFFLAEPYWHRSVFAWFALATWTRQPLQQQRVNEQLTAYLSKHWQFNSQRS
jgi:hypothetical protein